MARQGASMLSIVDFICTIDSGRPSWAPVRRKSMDSLDVVENRKRSGCASGDEMTNAGPVRQVGSRLVVVVVGVGVGAGAGEAGSVSSESRNRIRGWRRKEKNCHLHHRSERQHIPRRAMDAPPQPIGQLRLTPNDHHHHHQYEDGDDQRRRHPAHSRHIATATTTTTTTTATRSLTSDPRPCDLATPGRNVMLLLAVVVYLLVGFVPIATEAVDCFKCSSRNGSNPACEDPFHNLNTTRVNSPILPDPQPSVIYHTPCYAGKKGRDGLFPASACIKLTGVFDTTGETLIVRHCALDSGTLTQDTELARMSHCGKFQFEGDLLRGCVLACPEDACNSARGSPLVDRGGTLNWLIVWALVWFALVILVANP